ncbi:hypothetical protein HRbin23_01640 [bacterium HR23]|nr:hypothetical protein HRbin23_01640 [bacterium HR23]
MREPRKERFPALLVVGVLLLAFGLMWNARGSFSLLYLAFQREYGWSPGLSTLGYAFSWLAVIFLTPIAAAWVDKAGPRRAVVMGLGCTALLYGALALVREVWHYVLAFGVLQAMAQALVATGSTAYLARRFPRRRGSAIGGMAVGYSLGPVLILPVLGWTMGALGLRSALVLMVLPPFLLLPLVALLDPPPAPQARQAGAPVGALREAVGTLAFWSLAVLYVSGVVAYNIVLVHQAAAAEGLGSTASWIVMALTGSFAHSALGSLAGGSLSDRIGRVPVWLGGSLLSALAVGLLALVPPGAGGGPLAAYAVLLGLGTGARLALLGTLAADLYAGPAFGRIYGVLQAIGAIGGAVGPLVAGFLRETSGSYQVPFLVAGLAYLISGLAVLPLRRGLK